MLPFTEKVLEIIKEIPSGSVMTYGQIAAIAGSKRGARQVARILHSMSEKYSLPWHRVVNAQGKIVLHNQELANRQKELLENEGVFIQEDQRIDLNHYKYTGEMAFEKEKEDFPWE
ncbi:MGMT family protein [Cytobacillus gottheilii]|uniref:MGMT family protein n=1 Tax=Cytobacillus gottheilii TaxID=859144 RepID=UPI00082F4B6F|nr:MGMT family protein [Cytobacillus gottheilii]